MKRLALFAMVGCGGAFGSGTDGQTTTDSGPGDATGCRLAVSFMPTDPIAGPGTMIRASVDTSVIGGVPTLDWTVMFQGNPVTFTTEPPNGEAIDFAAPDAGSYHVTAIVSPVNGCDEPSPIDIYVAAPGANMVDYRLRVVPPANVPAQDTIIHVFGGADKTLPPLGLDAGFVNAGTVKSIAGAGVPAYIRFSSPGTRVPLIETFADDTGSFQQRLLGGPYDVLVVPTTAGVASERIKNWFTTTTLQLTASSAITGTVKDPTGQPLAGAKVELHVDDVPTTVTTTALNGQFTVLGHRVAGATVEIAVTPANTSLPRLVASSTTIDLAQPILINYAASLNTLASLAGVHVRRGGAAAPGAQVVIAGSVAAAGTVNGTSANVSAVVNLAATATAAGDLPAGLVAPRAVLTAVVTPSAGAPGLAAIDLTGTVPPQIDTANPVNASGVVKSIAQVPLDRAVVEATPIGALATAGGAAVRASTATNGSFTLSLASGGHYTLRISDPQRRGALVELADVTSATVPASAALPKSLTVSGYITAASQPIGNASIQLLCVVCSGIAASKPFAEAATDSSGGFAMAVPDPGTM